MMKKHEDYGKDDQEMNSCQVGKLSSQLIVHSNAAPGDDDDWSTNQYSFWWNMCKWCDEIKVRLREAENEDTIRSLRQKISEGEV